MSESLLLSPDSPGATFSGTPLAVPDSLRTTSAMTPAFSLLLHPYSGLDNKQASTSTPAFPCRPVHDDDPHSFTCNGRAVCDANGREKHYPDPAWNERLAAIGGRNIYGKPIFRVAWGLNELSGNGDLRFRLHPFQWLLLRRYPAEKWGTRRSWYLPRIDEGKWVPSLADTWGEEYPWAGGDEIEFAFDVGVPVSMEYLESRIRRFLAREPLPSREQRKRNSRAELEAADQAAWNRDYEQHRDAARAFYGNPFRGYGPKAGELRAKTEPMTPGMNAKFESIHAGRMERLRRQRIEGR